MNKSKPSHPPQDKLSKKQLKLIGSCNKCGGLVGSEPHYCEPLKDKQECKHVRDIAWCQCSCHTEGTPQRNCPKCYQPQDKQECDCVCHCPNDATEACFDYHTADCLHCQPPSSVQEWEKEFNDEVYIPHQIVDGDFCENSKKPIYIEDTGGKRVVGYKEYPKGECECGTEEVIKNVKSFISKTLLKQKEEYRKKIDKLIRFKKEYCEPEKDGVTTCYEYTFIDKDEVLKILK